MIINKAYLGDITATNMYKSLPTRRRRKPAGINMEQNYFTVTLCILSVLLTNKSKIYSVCLVRLELIKRRKRISLLALWVAR